MRDFFLLRAGCSLLLLVPALTQGKFLLANLGLLLGAVAASQEFG